MAWITHHKLIFFILLLVILGLGYMLFQDQLTNVTLSDVTELTQKYENDAEYQEALALLNQVRKITLDTSVLENEDFRSLFDFTQPIDSKPSGRRNPFLPIGR